MKKKTEEKSKPMLVSFLLDRSGSMAACSLETISGFNGYIDSIINGDTGKSRFSLTQFDSQGIDLIHDAVPLNKVDKLTSKTFVPRGNTPLHDAIGKTIQAATKRAKDAYKVLFVTLTDGQENSSSDWTSQSIKQLIKDKEAEGWTFAHIGVGVGGWAATNDLAQGTKSAANFVHVSPKNVARSFQSMAGATMSYSKSSSVGTDAKLFAGHKDGVDEN